jgi:4'-phosphopantetheinyl transferase
MISNGMARLVVNMKEAYMTPATWKLCYSLFRAEDAAKIQRFRFEKDRRLSLGSQLLQRAVIAWTFGVSYSEIVISRTEKGKPFFKYTPTHPGELPGEGEAAQVPFPNWNYNVSHHGDFVGIASEPVCLVGLDIMNAKEKPRGGGRERGAHDFFKSFHRQLSATEWGSIYEAPSEETKLERFYRQWALKVGRRGV